MSHRRQTWSTPDWLFECLNNLYDFDFDPCPHDFDPCRPDSAFDGLEVEWGYSNFVDPPYNDIDRWMDKGRDEWMKGKTVVYLLPARTDRPWWHKHVMQAEEIAFIKGRLRFSGSTTNAPFPSVIVSFLSEHPYPQRPRLTSVELPPKPAS